MNLNLAGRLRAAPWPEVRLLVRRPESAQFDFGLRNYTSETLLLKRIVATPELPDDTLVEDILVGRNSQVAAVGTFKASILGRLPPIRFDHVPPGMDVRIAFAFADSNQSCYEGRIEFEMSEKETGDRHLLYPMNATTQIEGKLIELCVTRQLFQAIEAGQVSIELKRRPAVPEYQEAPETTHEFDVKSSRIKPSKPIDLPAGSTVTLSFFGDRAEEFVPADAVGILQLNVTRF